MATTKRKSRSIVGRKKAAPKKAAAPAKKVNRRGRPVKAKASTKAPAKNSSTTVVSSKGKQKVTGKGSKTVNTARGKLANVTREQLAASGHKSLTSYMNAWNKTGKRPTKRKYPDLTKVAAKNRAEAKKRATKKK